MNTNEKLKSIADRNGARLAGSGMQCMRTTFAYLDSAENMKRRAAAELSLTRKNAEINRRNGRTDVAKYVAIGLARVAFYRKQAAARIAK